jgi:hypothetical protein
MKRPPGTETAAYRNATVLSVGPNDADDVSLECIFQESDGSLYANSELTLSGALISIRHFAF